MIILTTSTSEQTIRVIPRSYPDEISLVLRDEITNEVTTKTIESLEWDNNNDFWNLANYDWNETGGIVYDNGYLVITTELALVENHFYELTIKDGANTIYKDKIFCTDQTISDYSVNNNEYVTENSYDNDYIVI